MFYSVQIKEIDFYCEGDYDLAEKLEEQYEGKIIRFWCEIDEDILDEDDINDILEEKLVEEIIRLSHADVDSLKYDHFEKG